MIELMVVVAMIAIAAGIVSLTLRDDAATRLEREAVRLATLLESARTEARIAGLAVHWRLTPESGEHPFRFIGLPPAQQRPTQWLDESVVAQIDGGRPTLVLGPEPLLDAQQVTLRLGERSITIATDGVHPFAIREPLVATP